MTTASLLEKLGEAQIEEFGREMDAIRDEVMDSRGERDRQYILKVIRIQRSLAVIGRFIMYAALFWCPHGAMPLLRGGLVCPFWGWVPRCSASRKS